MATGTTPMRPSARDDRMLDRVRSVWDEPRPFTPPPRVWWDWALVGVLVPLTVLEGLLRPDLPSRVVWVIVVAGLVPTVLRARLAAGVSDPIPVAQRLHRHLGQPFDVASRRQ
jgi:hypothetical protein